MTLKHNGLGAATSTNVTSHFLPHYIGHIIFFDSYNSVSVETRIPQTTFPHASAQEKSEELNRSRNLRKNHGSTSK